MSRDTENNDIIITMTMTAPNCPISEMILDDVKASLSNLEGVNDKKSI
jgi:metal-sulfur cluster biosynthetic enzyme